MSTTKKSLGLREYSRADLIEYLDWLYWENCEDHFDIDAIERVATILVDGKRYWSLTDEQLETVFELFHDVTREVTTAQIMYMFTSGELSDLGSGYVPLHGDTLVVGKVWNSVQRRYTYWIERDYYGMTDEENREIDALVLKGYEIWFVS